MAELDGRVIAVAGAGGGLGPVVARRLTDEGAILALTDVHADRLNALVDELALPEDRLDARTIDLLDEDEASRWADWLEQRFGRTDCLLHLVGGWRGGEPIDRAPLADYEWLHNLLVRSLQYASRAFYEALLESPHGRFICISSSQARAPSGTNASYASAKAAAEAWTLALADAFEEAQSAATANVIVVNAILTPQMRAANPDNPYRTFTSAEDIADAIAFLCSDSAARMNGQRLSLHP